MLQASVCLAEEFGSLVSFLLSNRNCLYFAVSVFHSAEDLIFRGLIDSVILDLFSLFSLVHSTEANTHLMVKHWSFFFYMMFRLAKRMEHHPSQVQLHQVSDYVQKHHSYCLCCPNLIQTTLVLPWPTVLYSHLWHQDTHILCENYELK